MTYEKGQSWLDGIEKGRVQGLEDVIDIITERRGTQIGADPLTTSGVVI
jgi:hypothetical protein